ncbi:MAG: M20 family metallopeptidase, partial [Deltaproteobacteria bacterium]|nr:M20 family metallopeptidase [Deltaproteobacteria bacterium]
QPPPRWAADLRNLLVWGYVVRAYHQVAVRTLSQLVALPTVAEGDGLEVARESRKAFEQRLEQLCRSWGLGFDRLEGGRALRISAVHGPNEAQQLYVLATVDTAGAVAEGWRRPPFAGEVTGGEVVGRGAVAKGGLVAMLLALKAIHDAQLPLPAHPVLLVSFGGEAARRRGIGPLPVKLQSEVAFLAGGAFPVGIGESGLAALVVTAPPDPPGATPREEAPGFKLIEVAVEPAAAGKPAAAVALLDPRDIPLRRATAIARRSLSQWTLAHSGSAAAVQEAEGRYLRLRFFPTLPPAGAGAAGRATAPLPEPEDAAAATGPGAPPPDDPGSALSELLAFLGRQLGVFPDARGRLARFLGTKLALAEDGRELGLALTHPGGFPPTRLRLERWEQDGRQEEAGGARAFLGIRWPPGKSAAEVIRAVSEAAAAYARDEGGALLVRGEGVGPHLLPAEDPRVRILLRAYEEATRQEAFTHTSPTPTVAKGFAPAPVFGPLAPRRSFVPDRPDEAIRQDELISAARIYCVALLRLLDERGKGKGRPGR